MVCDISLSIIAKVYSSNNVMGNRQISSTSTSNLGLLLWKACYNADCRALDQWREHHWTESLQHIIEWKDPDTGQTCLHLASALGHAAVVQRLLLVHAKINVRCSREGLTPLHQAARCGHTAVLELLLEHLDIQPAQWNAHGRSPLDLARVTYGLSLDHDVLTCIHLLEAHLCLQEGWVYMIDSNSTSTSSQRTYLPASASASSKYPMSTSSFIRQTWKKRYLVILNSRDSNKLEMVFFKPSAEPASTNLRILRQSIPCLEVTYDTSCPKDAARPSKKSNSRVYHRAIRSAPRPYVLSFRARRKLESSSVILDEPKKMHFAALDQGDFDRWQAFFQQITVVAAAQDKDSTSSYNDEHQDPVKSSIQGLPKSLLDQKPTQSIVEPYQSSQSSQYQEDLSAERVLLRRVMIRSREMHQGIVLSTEGPAGAPTRLLRQQQSRPSTGQPTHLGPELSKSKPSFLPRNSSSNEQPDECCVVCMDEKRNAVCIPCGHVAACFECLTDVKNLTGLCPVCRGPIREVIRLYQV